MFTSYKVLAAMVTINGSIVFRVERTFLGIFHKVFEGQIGLLVDNETKKGDVVNLHTKKVDGKLDFLINCHTLPIGTSLKFIKLPEYANVRVRLLLEMLKEGQAKEVELC